MACLSTHLEDARPFMRSRFASRYLLIFGLMAVLGLGAVAAFNWHIDPLQFYRKASYRPYFSDQPRWQNPGLARNYEYDTVIIGTSVSLGFDLEQVKTALRCQPMNFAMQGASAHEQRLLLNVALRTGKVKRVIWDLNYEFFRGSPTWVSDIDGAFPEFFYDTNAWNEMPRYLLNFDILKSSARVLLHRYPTRELKDLSQQHKHRKPGFASVSAAFTRARKGDFIFKTRPAEFAEKFAPTSFRQNVLEVVKSHPEVEFDLHFPPFSVAYHALVRDVNSAAFDHMLAWKREVENEVRLLKNVRLFDFQGDAAIVEDFERYHDTVHFDRATHSEMIESIRDDHRRATAEELAQTEAFLFRDATADWVQRLERR